MFSIFANRCGLNLKPNSILHTFVHRYWQVVSGSLLHAKAVGFTTALHTDNKNPGRKPVHPLQVKIVENHSGRAAFLSLFATAANSLLGMLHFRQCRGSPVSGMMTFYLAMRRHAFGESSCCVITRLIRSTDRNCKRQLRFYSQS